MATITGKGDCKMVMAEPALNIQESGDLKATVKSPSFVMMERKNKIENVKQSNYQNSIKEQLFILNMVTSIISASENEIKREFYKDYYLNRLVENIVENNIEAILDDIIILPELNLQEPNLSLEISPSMDETLDLLNNSMGSIDVDDKIDTISIQSDDSDITIDLLDESIFPIPDIIHSIKDIRKLHASRHQPQTVNCRYTNPDHESSTDESTTSESSDFEKNIIDTKTSTTESIPIKSWKTSESILLNISNEEEPTIRQRKKKHVQFANENLFNNGEEIKIVKSLQPKSEESLSKIEMLLINMVFYIEMFFHWSCIKFWTFRNYIYKSTATSYGKGKIHKPTGRPLDEMMLKAKMTCPSSRLMSETYNKRLMKATSRRKMKIQDWELKTKLGKNIKYPPTLEEEMDFGRVGKFLFETLEIHFWILYLCLFVVIVCYPLCYIYRPLYEK